MMMPPSMLPSQRMRNGRGGRSAGLRIGIAGLLLAHVALLVVLSGLGRRAPAVDGPAALDATPMTIAVTALEAPPETAVADPGYSAAVRRAA